jgi:quercetin dioxygenase-like cupin family protein
MTQATPSRRTSTRAISKSGDFLLASPRTPPLKANLMPRLLSNEHEASKRHRTLMRATLVPGIVIVGLGIGQSVLHSSPEEQHVSPQGYVLGPAEGEHLIRNAGSIFIKVDPTKGSHNMALGTQQLPIGRGIAVHQHREADEALFVLEGTAFGILGDRRIPIEKGSAIYVPRGRLAWS